MNRTALLIALAALPAACSDPVAPLLWFDRIETPAVPTGRLALTSLNYGVDVFDMIAGSFEPVSDERSNCVSWHPDGEQMLLENLVIVQLTGERARIPTGSDSILAGCGEFTADGSWIFFEGHRPTDGGTHIWRIRADGTQLEQVMAGAQMPSPSPDGTRVAFKRYGVLQGYAFYYVMTRTVGSEAIDTISPPIRLCESDPVCAGGITGVRWSPTGEWIAYATKSAALRGGGPYISLTRYGSLVLLVRPDGSETRTIGPPGSEPHHHGFQGDINWSPDGEWLVGPSFPGSRIRLVHLASGEGVMLNTSVGGFLSSDWTQ
jgi:hypothetical protein